VRDVVGRVLIVDDDELVRTSLSRLMEAAGHSTATADSPEAARSALNASEFDLVLLDVRMPGGSGFEVLDMVTADSPDTAVVMVTGVDDPDAAAAAIDKGAYGYVVKPFGPNEIEIAALNALKRRDLERERRSLVGELADKVSARSTALQEVSVELARAGGETRLEEQETWVRLQQAVAIRNDETGRHIERVGRIAELVGTRMGLTEAAPAQLGMAAALHDVGKIGIPDALLLKPGALTPDEYAVIQQHSQIGYRMLSGSRSDTMSLAATIALAHHERWDGGGYPRGLVGEAIPLEARITSVVDAFDAITHKRVYRRAASVEEAIKILNEERGKQFDGEVVELVVDAIDDIAVILHEYPDEEEMRIRVLLVDDHQMFAEALVSFLAGKEDILAVGTAATMDDGRRQVRELKPDVVLMDYSLPDGTGIEAASLIKAEHPAANVLLLTGSDDPSLVSQAIQAGCAGYLTKDAPPDDVVDAIRRIHAGESVIPPEQLHHVLQGVSRTNRGLGYRISAREREILGLLAEGMSTEEIAEHLFLSWHTVRNHIQRIIGKLNAHSRLEAVTTAVREGVIQISA